MFDHTKIKTWEHTEYISNGYWITIYNKAKTKTWEKVLKDLPQEYILSITEAYISTETRITYICTYKPLI